MCRFLEALVLLIAFTLASFPALAVDANDQACASCRFKVDSLDRPFNLVGTWLFTRDDVLSNKEIAADTSTWRIIRAPGSWKQAYGDGKNFTVGWYRGVFEFAPHLVGKDVILFVEAYISRVSIYVDGQEVYRRPSTVNFEPYYATRPIPVRFRITQARQVIAIRVETPLMKGIYQVPFELRQYDPHDLNLSLYQFMGGDARLIAASLALFFGLFYAAVYWKIRERLYLIAAINSLVVIPFFCAPSDTLLRIIEPESLLYLHYAGLVFTFTSYLFCQFFYKFTPRINWVGGFLLCSMALVLASMVRYPNLDLFQSIRPVYLFLTIVFICGSTYLTARAVWTGKQGAYFLFAGNVICLGTGLNDLLLALGLIDSVALFYVGSIAFNLSMQFVASSIFARTFIQNVNLVTKLSNLNDHLEDLVCERTDKLQMTLQDLDTANQDLRASYEQLNRAKDELVRSEKMAALGSLVAGISHELNTPIGNGLMAISTLRANLAELKGRIGEKTFRRSTLDAFVNSVDVATQITERSLARSAELVTSFKQIAIDQSTSNRRKFNLIDLIHQTLVILQPTMKGTPYQINFERPESAVDLTMDSDPGALVQVLTNLVQNSVIHGFDGRDHGQITITAEAADPEHLSLRVTDNGKGIAAKNLQKVFDPFFTTKLGCGGSGLGLHISYNIVTQVLGGTLQVTSAPEQGTEFTLTLPITWPVVA